MDEWFHLLFTSTMKDGVIVKLIFLMRKLQLEMAGDSICPKVRSLKAKWMEAFKNHLSKMQI